jgi:hypothetical protein
MVESVSPASAIRGNTLDVTVTGENFEEGSSVSFGIGIRVNTVTFTSGTELTVNITIAASAALGDRDVTVTNPNGRSGSLLNGFEVLPQVNPTISSVVPNQGFRGATLDVVINGIGFQSGASVTFSGPGIRVNTVAFDSALKLTVNITIAGTAPTNRRTVRVTNPDGGTGFLANAFKVRSR